MQRQQCVNRPAMVRDACRHGRRRLLRMGQTPVVQALLFTLIASIQNFILGL